MQGVGIMSQYLFKCSDVEEDDDDGHQTEIGEEVNNKLEI